MNKLISLIASSVKNRNKKFLWEFFWFILKFSQLYHVPTALRGNGIYTVYTHVAYKKGFKR